MANEKHERVLRQFFADEAAVAAPADLLDRSLARTVNARRRPAWYARIRDVGIAWSMGMERPTVRVAYVLVILGLVLAALFAAFAAGAFRRDQAMPLGRNGLIAYYWQGNDYNRYAGGTFVMNADGTGEQRLVDGRCPTFSANGSTLAYASGDASDTWIANPYGSSPHPVPGVRSSYGGLGPDWGHALSPDGSRIAWWSARDELWVSPTAGGEAIRVVPPSGDANEAFWVPALAPAWSPDGSRIAFARFSSVGDGDAASYYRSAIAVIDADGSNLRNLTTRPGADGDSLGIAWSPDGRFIAYPGLQDGSPIPRLSPDGDYPPDDIFVINADGTGDRSLTNTPDDEQEPAWSPDGTRLAWATAGTEGQRLTTVRMDGRDPVGAPNAGPLSIWFAWSPNAAALVFGRLPIIDAELVSGGLQIIDADLQRAPTTVREFDGTLLCPPSWQRLDP